MKMTGPLEDSCDMISDIDKRGESRDEKPPKPALDDEPPIRAMAS